MVDPLDVGSLTESILIGNLKPEEMKWSNGFLTCTVHLENKDYELRLKATPEDEKNKNAAKTIGQHFSDIKKVLLLAAVEELKVGESLTVDIESTTGKNHIFKKLQPSDKGSVIDASFFQSKILAHPEKRKLAGMAAGSILNRDPAPAIAKDAPVDPSYKVLDPILKPSGTLLNIRKETKKNLAGSKNLYQDLNHLKQLAKDVKDILPSLTGAEKNALVGDLLTLGKNASKAFKQHSEDHSLLYRFFFGVREKDFNAFHQVLSEATGAAFFSEMLPRVTINGSQVTLSKQDFTRFSDFIKNNYAKELESLKTPEDAHKFTNKLLKHLGATPLKEGKSIACFEVSELNETAKSTSTTKKVFDDAKDKKNPLTSFKQIQETAKPDIGGFSKDLPRSNVITFNNNVLVAIEEKDPKIKHKRVVEVFQKMKQISLEKFQKNPEIKTDKKYKKQFEDWIAFNKDKHTKEGFSESFITKVFEEFISAKPEEASLYLAKKLYENIFLLSQQGLRSDSFIPENFVMSSNVSSKLAHSIYLNETADSPSSGYVIATHDLLIFEEDPQIPAQDYQPMVQAHIKGASAGKFSTKFIYEDTQGSQFKEQNLSPSFSFLARPELVDKMHNWLKVSPYQSPNCTNYLPPSSQPFSESKSK